MPAWVYIGIAVIGLATGTIAGVRLRSRRELVVMLVGVTIGWFVAWAVALIMTYLVARS